MLIFPLSVVRIHVSIVKSCVPVSSLFKSVTSRLFHSQRFIPLVDTGTLKYGSSGMILMAGSFSTGMLPFVVTERNAVDLSTTSVSLEDG